MFPHTSNAWHSMTAADQQAARTRATPATLNKAAPGMLAALKLTLAELQGPERPYSADSHLPPCLVRMIAKTIAEAEGRNG